MKMYNAFPPHLWTPTEKRIAKIAEDASEWTLSFGQKSMFRTVSFPVAPEVQAAHDAEVERTCAAHAKGLLTDYQVLGRCVKVVVREEHTLKLTYNGQDEATSVEMTIGTNINQYDHPIVLSFESEALTAVAFELRSKLLEKEVGSTFERGLAAMEGL